MASVRLRVRGVGTNSADRKRKNLIDFIVGFDFILNHLGNAHEWLCDDEKLMKDFQLLDSKDHDNHFSVGSKQLAVNSIWQHHRGWHEPLG